MIINKYSHVVFLVFKIHMKSSSVNKPCFSEWKLMQTFLELMKRHCIPEKKSCFMEVACSPLESSRFGNDPFWLYLSDYFLRKGTVIAI